MLVIFGSRFDAGIDLGVDVHTFIYMVSVTTSNSEIYSINRPLLSKYLPRWKCSRLHDPILQLLLRMYKYIGSDLHIICYSSVAYNALHVIRIAGYVRSGCWVSLAFRSLVWETVLLSRIWFFKFSHALEKFAPEDIFFHYSPRNEELSQVIIISNFEYRIRFIFLHDWFVYSLLRHIRHSISGLPILCVDKSSRWPNNMTLRILRACFFINLFTVCYLIHVL
jgi:hypothetical protein